MSEFIDQIPAAAGGLNYDDDPRFFEKGDTDYRLNVIPTSLGDTYVLTNIKGTTKKTHSFTHDASYDGATYTTLGSCYDIERNSVYFFIYSDANNHCILRYNIDDDDFDKIVWDNENIGLDSSYPIHDAFMIDNWLYWNTETSSPRAINVEWAYYDYVAYPAEYDSGTETAGTAGYLTDTTQSFSDSVADNMVVYNTTDSTSATIDNVDSGTVLDLSADIMDVDESYVIYKASFAVGDYVKDNWGRVYVCIQSWSSGRLEPSEQPDYFTLVSNCYNDIYGVGSGSAGQPYRQRHFYNTVYPISQPLQYEFKSASGGEPTSENHIRGHVFQFTYRFYIPELGYTASAPFTSVVATAEGEQYNGEWANAPQFNNYIQLTLGAPVIESDENQYDFLFDHVEILVRNGSDARWKAVDRIPHGDFIVNDGGTITYNFINDTNGTVVDDASIEVPFNYLPLTSKSQCALDGSRVAYGGITEGFDIPNVDVDLSYAIEEIEYGQLEGSSLAETISFTESITYDDIGRPIYQYTATGLTTGAYVGHLLVATIDGQEYHYTMLATDDDSDADYAAAVAKVINFSDVNAEASSNDVETGRTTEQHAVSVARYSTTAASDFNVKYTTLKSGAWHKYCLFYYDSLMRRTAAVPLDPVYVNFPPEELTKPGSSLTDGTGFRHYLEYTINHDAPSWASYWRFGYSGNTTISRFWQYNIAAAGEATTGPQADLSYVDISPLQGITDDDSLDINILNCQIEPYQFEEGDRVRFITEVNATATDSSDLALDDWGGGSHDYEIVDFDPTTNYIYFNSDGPADSDNVIGDGSGSTTDYNDGSVLAEIYRPKKDSNTVVYYEIGKMNPCSSGTHSNASGDLQEGDTYMIARTPSKTPTGTWTSAITPLYVESFSFSDFYESEWWSKGKAGFAYTTGEKSLNIIRYSNKYIKNTLSSGLGRFDGLDYTTVSYNYGNISAIRQIGNTLKVVFENNVASVGVNRTQFYDADGQSQVVKSDQVLGSVNYSEELWGTVNPESVRVVDRNLYFWDLRRKSYVRNAPNGSFPVSDYKMRKYFIDKADDVLTSGISGVNVYSFWDDDHDLLGVVFKDTTTPANDEVLLFHEPTNRWVSFVEYYTDVDTYNASTFVDDTETDGGGTGPEMNISVVTNTTTQAITFEATENGTLDLSSKYQTGSSIDLEIGDVVTASVAWSGDDWAGAMYFYLDYSAAGPSDVLLSENGTTSSTATITDVCTLAPYIYGDISGVTSGESITMTVTLTITRHTTPIILGAPSSLVGCYDEDVYIYNDSTTYCNFYGDQKTYTVRIYSTQNPNIIKLFDSIAIHTNKPFDVTDIQIPASPNYSNGMQSRIKEARFEKEEGVYRSNYLCNMKTSSATANVKDLFNGDSLRGYYIYNDLDGDETVKHTLYKVDILSTTSKY